MRGSHKISPVEYRAPHKFYNLSSSPLNYYTKFKYEIILQKVLYAFFLKKRIVLFIQQFTENSKFILFYFFFYKVALYKRKRNKKLKRKFAFGQSSKKRRHWRRKKKKRRQRYKKRKSVKRIKKFLWVPKKSLRLLLVYLKWLKKQNPRRRLVKAGQGKKKRQHSKSLINENFKSNNFNNSKRRSKIQFHHKNRRAGYVNKNTRYKTFNQKSLASRRFINKRQEWIRSPRRKKVRKEFYKKYFYMTDPSLFKTLCISGRYGYRRLTQLQLWKKKKNKKLFVHGTAPVHIRHRLAANQFKNGWKNWRLWKIRPVKIKRTPLNFTRITGFKKQKRFFSFQFFFCQFFNYYFAKPSIILYKSLYKILLQNKVFKKDLRQMLYRAYSFRKQKVLFDLLVSAHYLFVFADTNFLFPLLIRRLVVKRRHYKLITALFYFLRLFFIIKRGVKAITIFIKGTFDKHARARSALFSVGQLKITSYRSAIIYDALQCPTYYGMFFLKLWVYWKEYEKIVFVIRWNYLGLLC